MDLQNSFYDEDLYERCEDLSDLNKSLLDKELYEHCEKFENQSPNLTVTRGVKRKRVSEESSTPRDSSSASAVVIEPLQTVGSQQPSTSRTTTEPPPSPIVGDTVECKICQRNVSRRYYTQHLKSNIHKNNCVKFKHSKPNVELIEAAFGNRLLTYRIVSDQGKRNHEFETPELFFERIKTSLNQLIDETVTQLTIFKVSFILHAEFIQESKGIINFFDFNVLSWTICKGDDKETFFENLKNALVTKISNFEKKDSGWSLKHIKYIDMNINQFNPLRGSSYIDLPHDIKTKKAIINVQNYDHECLKWALLSALYPVKDSSQRVSSYIKNQNKLKFADVPFPVKLTDIHKVEKLNDLSINVFGLCYNENLKSHEVNGPLYFTKCRKSTHINLLFISKGSQSHYCYIKNLSRLVSRQISTTNCSFHICDGCLLAFYSSEQLTNHQKNDCGHVVVELPNHEKTKKNWFGDEISCDKLIFDKYQRKLKLPFVVYADFEAFLNPIASCDPDTSKSYTKNIQQHEMYSFGYFIKCSFDDSLSKYCTYTGSDCAKVFMDSLYSDLEKLNKLIRFRKNPIPLNQDDLNIISNVNNKCFICDNDLRSQSVFSYDWTTGKFQGVAHKVCDNKFTPPAHVPVFFHNLSNYDAHFIVKALNFREGAIDVIPQNKEKYISFSKQLKFDKRFLSLRFVDSFRFMSSSLDSLARNLQEYQFIELRKQYPRDEDFKLLKQKGIFPYEFMKSNESLEASSLPKIGDFYSSLTDSCITSEDYQHAQNVWNNFNCNTMLDYSNLYLKTDVLLLTDIFENFRSVCIETYDLDPAHYFTAPGLSWDAMLKITGVQLELLTDFDKVSFIKKGLRGGISQCSNRYAKSNNHYMPDFDSDQATSYLIYLDANNLYGWAMSQHLPVGEFEWVDPETDFRISKDANYGYILEVDLEYPDSLHDSHSDLPFCPEHIIVDENCLHLQLYRDPKDRFKKGQTKASLSLQQFLGFESGFTLDKESNTIAIICQDVIVVLAFETRERLIAWQVKVGGQLGSSKEWLVMIGGGSRKLPAGPARLHLQGRRFALASGVPPRLLGLWELAHLRRYGVVEGRFCFEGGSHCGKGEGLHVLITDQAQDIADGFDAAAHGNPRAPASRKSGGADRNRPDTRLSDFNPGDQSIPDTGLYEENFFGEDCGGVSPFWPSDERRGFDEHDCKECEEPGTRPPWSGADHVTLERCSNCVTKLGTMTRSSTVALTPATQFNPAWTMEAVPESSSDNSSNSTEYLTPRAIKKSLEASQCDWAPQRPPKPARLDEKKPPATLPASVCACSNDRNHSGNANNPKVGPYENYDVPKATHVEVESTNMYYDTPKRIKQALTEDLFQVTKTSAPGNLVLKKNCGCILKFGSKKKPVIVECDENIQPVECPCQKVTNWANNLISLPYCKRNVNYDKVNTEVLTSQKSEDMALYATVDVTRKTNRQSSINEKEMSHDCSEPFMNYENLGPKGDNEFEDPYANYENLEFALSLEYYENAKDLLKKAGVTQKELDALSANVDFAEIALPTKPKNCAKCGHSAKHQLMKKNKSDEYLLMEPAREIKRDLCRTTGPNPGYTPMSPNPNWSQSLRHPLQKLHRVDIEKSHSIPTLNGTASRAQSFDVSTSSNNNKEAIQKRSSSVDSARLLEDLKEFDSSIGSHATSSSLETLRNLAIENRRTSSPCNNERGCCDHDCCKSSDSENKTSEGSCSKDMPHLRNKHMDNAQIKRSSSVPCKSGGNRDSSSSNDSGVSSCSMKQGPEFNEFEMPLTSGHSRYQYMAHRKMRGNATGCIHSSLQRKSKSSDLLKDMTMQIHKTNVPAKSSSAEAEVPVLPPKQFKGVMDTHSTSSGTSDMSDYIETLSLTSSHSSSDNPNIRMARQPTMTLRPRSGKEYHNLDPIITSMYKNGKELSNYTNLP